MEISGRVLAAKQEAERIVADARRKAAEIVNQAEADAERARESIEASVVAEAEAQVVALRDGFGDEVAPIEDRIRQRQRRGRRRCRGDGDARSSRDGRQATGRRKGGGHASLVPMAKVELIGPKNKFFEVVSLLHEQGKLHIEDLTKKISSGEVPLDQMEVVANQQAERDRMEDLLIRVRAIIKALHLPGVTIDEAKRQKEYLRLWKLDTAALADEVDQGRSTEVEDTTSELAHGRSPRSRARWSCSRATSRSSRRSSRSPSRSSPRARSTRSRCSFERRYKGALDQLKEELDKITHKQCEIVSTDVDEDTTAAIVVFNRSYSEPVHKFLAMENVNQIRLPSDFQDMPFDVAYDVIKERRQDAAREARGGAQASSRRCRSTWYLRLATIRDVLADKIDEIKAIPKFGQTEYAFVITGWIPVDGVKELRKTLFEHVRRRHHRQPARDRRARVRRHPGRAHEPEGGRAVRGAVPEARVAACRSTARSTRRGSSRCSTRSSSA